MGHAGFKLSFSDPKDPSITRVIYIDPWITGCPNVAEDFKKAIPTDADLVLVTHGHFDHSINAPDLIKASTKPDAKIVCNYELVNHYKKHT